MIIFDETGTAANQWYDELSPDRQNQLYARWCMGNVSPGKRPPPWWLNNVIMREQIDSGQMVIQYTPPNYIDSDRPWTILTSIRDFVAVPWVAFYLKLPNFKEFRYRNLRIFNTGEMWMATLLASFHEPEYPPMARFATLYGKPELLMIRELDWGTSQSGEALNYYLGEGQKIDIS